ncbi:16S rRNA (cytosine(1402)-N(4))-methyltransferase RsmH, partial [Candidatus Gracilibacteria bacterium]|nr:16S rRNA (cytosine(1402)-N(4))-methyltransferase RsmH [Candidatus Gracilibacteria bacterium]
GHKLEKKSFGHKLEKKSFGHIPVLFAEILDIIDINKNKQNIVVDATIGAGGHAIGVIKKLNKNDIFVGFDLDKDNLELAKNNINTEVGQIIKKRGIKTYFIHSSFSNLKKELLRIKIAKISAVYYDLGVSSIHLDDVEKGFSFRFDSNLDMRFDKTQNIKTAKDIINDYSSSELFKIFKQYGEEKKAKFIVEEIIKTRKQKPINTTFDLVNIIEKSSFDPKSKLRVFQALRIEVNQEFESIEKSLHQAVDLLEIGGTLSVITFHSLEDRLVKQTLQTFLQEEKDDITGQTIYGPILQKIYKKPLIPKEKEVESNPRSRSAKLRAFKKINILTF